MKATEWQELQRLLKVADQQGFVQEALVETGLASKEQLPLIPGQKFHACLKGETTSNWQGYPKAKAKPMVIKGGCSSQTPIVPEMVGTGAMTDARAPPG